jgi:tape measure domain-containing protein
MAEHSYGALLVRVTADTTGLARQVEQAARGAGASAGAMIASGVTSKAGEAGRASGEAITNGITTSVTRTTLAGKVSGAFTGIVDSAKKAGNGIISGLSDAAGWIGDKLLKGGLFATAAAAGTMAFEVVKSGASFNILSQRATAAFTTILGSASAAKQMMSDITAFSLTSPFPREVFIQAAQQMLSFGVAAKSVIPYLQAIQDAIATMGGSATDISGLTLIFSQIQAAGKITGTDLMQMGQYGINAAELIGKSMHKTGAQITAEITKGSLGATDALNALSAGMEQTYAGGAARYQQTWGGALDHVKASMRNLGSVLLAPFIDPNGGGYAIKWGVKLGDLFNGLAAKLKPLEDRLTLHVKPIMDGITHGLENITKALTAPTPMPQISLRPPAVTPAIRGAAPVFQAPAAGVPQQIFQAPAAPPQSAIQTWVTRITDALRKVDWGKILGDIIRSAASGAQQIGAAFGELLSKVDWVAVGRTLAFIAVPLGISLVNSLVDALISEARHHPLDLLFFITSLIPIGKGAGIIIKLLDKVPIVGPLAKALLGPIESAGKLVETGFGKVLGKIFGKTGERITGYLGDVAGKLKIQGQVIMYGLLDGLEFGWKLVLGWLGRLGGLLLRGMEDGWRGVLPWLGKIGEFILKPFDKASTWLLVRGGNIIAGLLRGVQNAWPVVTRWLGGLGGQITAIFAKAGVWLISHGSDVISGMLRGIQAGWRTALAWLGGMAARITAPFAKAATWLLTRGSDIISGMLRGIQNYWRTAASWLGGMQARVSGYFKTAASWLLTYGSNIISGMLRGIQNYWRTAAGWLTGMQGRVTGYFKTAGTWLVGHGADVVHGLLDGMKNGMKNIGSWVNNNIVQPIKNAVIQFFHLGSPSRLMRDLGSNVIAGFWQGLSKFNLTGMIGTIFGGMPQALGNLVNKGLISVTKLTTSALAALGGLGSKALSAIGGFLGGLFGGNKSLPAGVMNYANLVAQVANMLGVGKWTNVFLAQMATESGGNPRAINLTDSNAAAGTPSKGLMQVIQPTFDAYAGPFRSRGIWDPLANIYAAIAYAIARYGNNIPNVLGHGHGYAGGGIIPERVYGVGARTGVPYTFGENGPELVSPLTGSGGTRAQQLGGRHVTINVYPQPGQSEEQIAAAVSRRLAWVSAGGAP